VENSYTTATLSTQLESASMSTAVLESPERVTESLKDVAAAMTKAAEANGDADENGGAILEATAPDATNPISRFVYSTFYYTSYGIVFPTVFVLNVVPGLGPVARGLADGANAANAAIEERKARRNTRKIAAKDLDEAITMQRGVESLAAASS
jgi:hypothetical protein